MARLLFPDEGSRLVFRTSGAGKPLLNAAGGIATVYTTEQAIVLADIQTAEGVTIPGSVLRVGANSQLPLFLGPNEADTVWVRVDGGPASPVFARADDRIDALELELGRDGAGAVVRSVNGNLPDDVGNVQIASSGVTDATATERGVILLAGDLGGSAGAPTTPTAVHVTGAEIVAGIKTFSDKPVVPDESFALSKLTAAAVNSIFDTPFVVRTGNHTLTEADRGVLQVFDSAANVTLFVPGGLTNGRSFPYVQWGAGKVTVAPVTTVLPLSIRSSVAYVNSNAATSHAVTMPASITTGDGLGLMFALASETVTVTAPGDFALLGTLIGPTGATQRFYTKHGAPAADAGTTKTFTLSGGTPVVALTVALANAHPASMIDGVAPLGPDTASDPSADPYTTVYDGVLELSLRSRSDPATLTVPPAPTGTTMVTSGTTAAGAANTMAAMAQVATTVAAGTLIGERAWETGYGASRTVGIRPAVIEAVAVNAAGGRKTTVERYSAGEVLIVNGAALVVGDLAA
jgi:hypothetical protein